MYDADQLQERHRLREEALVSGREHKQCMDDGKRHYPFAKSYVGAACRQGDLAKQTGFVRLDLWEGISRIASVAGGTSPPYRFKMGCVSLCDCSDRDCYFPELVYRGEVPAPVAKDVTSGVKADVDFLVAVNEDKGRYGTAHKMCYMLAPKFDAKEKKCEGGEVTVSFIGETSGQLIKLGCRFEPDKKQGGCIALVRVKPVESPRPATQAEISASRRSSFSRDQPINFEPGEATPFTP